MSRKTIKPLSLLLALFLQLSYVPAYAAQNQVTGSVEGRVYDVNTSLGIAGATVLARNQETGLERTALTRGDGVYVIRLMPSGPYTITATALNYENVPNSTLSTLENFPIRITQEGKVPLPPIALHLIGSPLPTPPGTPPTATQPPVTQPPVTQPPVTQPGQRPQGSTGLNDASESEQLVNTSNATRGGNFDRLQLLALPFPGIRTFDDLAFLLPGVAPPPLAIGRTIGPGIGAGVGTSGQFSVNGLRSRSNNFTIDGSDNNDEDVGVRRQGFTSLVPQSIESLQEYHVATLLPEPQYGRNMAAQVDAVSRSGGDNFHGTLYGFFTHNSLRARDAFDLTGGPQSFTLTSSGRTVLRDGSPLTVANPVDGENKFTRAQYGLVFGGPIVKRKTHFFVSAERQDIDADRESHFAVPNIADRGLFGQGDKGLRIPVRRSRLTLITVPTTLNGDAFLSLFPFPNNPIGPYGNNTFTEILPADADGVILSGKLDHNIKAWGKDHVLTGRYNFTDDDTILPVTGEALFSSLDALVRTQNLSVIFTSQLSDNMANTARFSFGRTTLGFEEVRDPNLLPSQIFPDIPFLLNRPLFENVTMPGKTGPMFVTRGRDTETLGAGLNSNFLNGYDPGKGTGPIGQVLISGFSPIGVDVFNFPQGRTNNTFQYADTLIYDVGRHNLSMGFDIRQNHLDSFLDRNSRVIALFTAAKDIAKTSLSTKVIENTGPKGGGFYLGRDYAALGTPGGYYQNLTLGSDTNIKLRYWQNNFFFADQFRVSPDFTLTLGLRYELNTVPTEKDRRIESTFDDPEVQKFIALEKQKLGVSGLERFLAGRSKIYDSDHNNIAPHIAFAWDPTGKGKMALRGGYGIYYDQILGAVISQSRTVYPNFFTVNCAGTIYGGLGPNLDGKKGISAGYTNCGILTKPGTLNTFNEGTLALISEKTGMNLSSVSDLLIFLASISAAGPGFTLPEADLVTPYAQHWGLTLERSFDKGYLLSAAYVGTKGAHLLRFATPNGGPNAIPRIGKIVATTNGEGKGSEPVVINTGTNANIIPISREFPLLGSFTSIESDANSIYHSLQLQLNKRFSNNVQFTTAYTWSHAIDEVSDVFELAGARALPQDSNDFRSERGDANFDVRHRFVYSLIWELPFYSDNKILGGWQLASIGTFQTAQPYTLLNCCDANLDGNLTDRIGSRNAFRAQGIATVDLALNKNFKFSEAQRLEFRTEVFNLFNRTHFGIPVHQLFFGGFTDRPLDEKIYVDTTVPARTIQFGLRYSF